MPSVNTFNDIIHNMPQSEHAFRLAKDGLIARLRTSFVIKSSVLWDYVDAQDMGIDTDRRIKVYNDVQDMTLQDVINFQEKWIKSRTYYYGILGNKKELDMDALKKLGAIVELKTEDIFGY